VRVVVRDASVMGSPSPTVDDLKQLASDRCGLTDFGGSHHEAALEAWVADLSLPG
jgi:hypothetical protein